MTSRSSPGSIARLGLGSISGSLCSRQLHIAQLHIAPYCCVHIAVVKAMWLRHTFTMQKLLIDAAEAYLAALKLSPPGTPSIVVPDSVPILYFGDSCKYFESKLKILTVGKNPSGHEFPAVNPLLRFPAARSWNPSICTRSNTANLKTALDEYFKKNPYNNWFMNFETALRGFDASYYAGEFTNTALHTDLLSPVATNPIWTGLLNAHPMAAKALSTCGMTLWSDLIEKLQPDIILFSFGGNYLHSKGRSLIPLSGVAPWPWPTRFVFSSKPKVPITSCPVKLKGGKAVHLVFAPAGVKPLQMFTSLQIPLIVKGLKRQLLPYW